MNKKDALKELKTIGLILLIFATFLAGIVIAAKHDERASEQPEQPKPQFETLAAETSTEDFEAGLRALAGIKEEAEQSEAPKQEASEEAKPAAAQKPALVDDVEALAIIIYQEAGADAVSDETRLMVATVVINRVASPAYPDTVKGVALQPGQYGRLSKTGLRWPSRSKYSCEAHAVERARKIARRALEGERNLPPDVIYQAGFKQGHEIVAESDGILFCR